MKYALTVRAAATADVDEISWYIAQNNIDAANRFLVAAEAAFELLQDTPGAGPVFETDAPDLQGFRKWPIHGFLNYIVYYRVEVETVDIVRILHGARNLPDALRERS